ncbi:MAG: M81 family metallopeptidase [Alphaproteobacteria bacterium]|nr:M81 family metallopeptidase [Alphaproteobacteria bacterium]
MGSTGGTIEAAESAPRILVGRFFHESNGYNPIPTPRSGFEVLRGEDVLTSARNSGTTLSGILASLEEAGVIPIPVHSAASPPSGPVEHQYFLETLGIWLRAIERERPDAIAIELHGAMATTESTDADGEFLAGLRQMAGNTVVIGVGLDLHAHITPRMLDAADICIACKENPHADVVECGLDVGRLVMEVVRGDLHPVMTMAKARMLLPGKNGTGEKPLSDMHRRARALEASDPDVRDISLYNAFRFLDAPNLGQGVVVLTNGTQPRARTIATEFATAFWERRAEFVDDLLSIDEALHKVRSERRDGTLPFAIADMGDRVLAGAPGDSTRILATTLDHEHPFKAAFPVTDPRAVQTAQAAGLGANLTLPLGNTVTPGLEPLHVTGTVTRLTDGRFAMHGPYQAGETTSMGPTAVVNVDGRIAIVVTSKPAFSHDPNAFESQGIRVSELDFVVVKSGYHFELNFKGLAIPILVASPGLAFYEPGLLPRTLGRVWPDHKVADDWLIPPVVFARRRVATGG